MRSRTRLAKRKNVGRWAIVWASHIAVIVLSGMAAFLLRFDFSIPRAYWPYLVFATPVWVIVKSIAFRIAGLDRRGWRYVSMSDVFRLALANFLGSLLSMFIILFGAPRGFPRSIYILDFILCFLASAGMRLTVRALAEMARDRKGTTDKKRTLIYGAGFSGLTLLREIHNNPNLAYKVKGFVDDRPDKKDLHLGGVPVLGSGEDIKQIVDKYGIELILIAIPSASGAEMTRILKLSNAAACECRTVPGLSEIIEGRGLSNQIREVAVEDLLGRTPVHLDEAQILSTLEGRVILVTGAAGSIGSELCRQIARFKPQAIIGFEIAESPLFEIDREMKINFPNVPFFPEIGSIQNRARLRDVFAHYKPSVVYHAAAYKHVPLMEAHVFEAIENNIFGTYNVAMTAREFGAREFVMISSDKAIRPTNVMGATKRVAELVLRAFQNSGLNGHTSYVAVRFGNVLGSNGSVIPIFKKQIAAGGPVTVTHPEMRRFFMTIPEACQLVLQASAIGQGGQVCVLEMGDAVKIVDLAKNLILLSGLKPDEDIKIEFCGMRPGEKMYEEVTSSLEDTVPTTHEKIRIFIGDGIHPDSIETWLDTLRNICERRDTGRLVIALKELVVDYSPSANILQRAIGNRSAEAPVPVSA